MFEVVFCCWVTWAVWGCAVFAERVKKLTWEEQLCVLEASLHLARNLTHSWYATHMTAGHGSGLERTRAPRCIYEFFLYKLLPSSDQGQNERMVLSCAFSIRGLIFFFLLHGLFFI